MNNQSLDVFEIANEVADLPLYEREVRLAELYNTNKKIHKEVVNLLEVFDDPETDTDLFSYAQRNFLDKQIKPEELVFTVVKDYRLTKFLEEGGYGMVYKGEHINDKMGKQQVAIKVIKPVIRNSITYDLIAREADIMLSLYHKNIVKVIQIGSVNVRGLELDCHIMEFIDGEDIDTYFCRRRSSIAEKVECIADVLDGLHHAHGSGEGSAIIHSDIKPSNIKMRRNGEPVILDFSISQRMNVDTNVCKKQLEEYQKNHASIFSCPEFTSPEKLTPASDVYSVGLLLKSILLEPKPNYEHLNTPNIIDAKRFNFDFDKYGWSIKELDSIIKKAIAIDPKDRYQSAKAFATDLRKYLALETTSINAGSIRKILYKKVRSNRVLSLMFATFLFIGMLGGVNNLKALRVHNTHQTQTDIITAFSTSIDSFFVIDHRDRNRVSSKLRNALKQIKESKGYIQDGRINVASSIGRIANQIEDHALAVDAFDYVVTHTSDSSALSIAKIEKAKNMIQIPERRQEGQTLVDDVIGDVSNGFGDVYSAMAFLEVYDFFSRYSSRYHEEGLNYVSLLHNTSRYINTMPVYHKSLMDYLLLNEEYYQFFGDYASISAGSTEEHYQTNIKPVMSKLVKDTSSSITAAKFETEHNMDDVVAKLSILKTRALFENRQLEEAAEFSAQTIDFISTKWHDDSPIMHKALLVDFSVNRYLDLERAVESTQKVAYKEAYYFYGEDESLYLANNFYYVDALLNAGDFDTALKETIRSSSNEWLSKGKSSFDEYDSVRAMAIAYMRRTSYEVNESSKLIAAAYHRHTLSVAKHYPEYMTEHELMLADVILAHYERNSGKLFTLISKLLDAYQQEVEQSGFFANEIVLDLATILDLNNHPEMSSRYVELAMLNMENGNLFEMNYSIDLMFFFMTVSELALKHDKQELAKKSFAGARVIYFNQQHQLKHTLYADKMNKLIQKLSYI